MTDKKIIRPALHFTPKNNWMSDPNGCVYFNGVYHLFFQYHPYSTQWGPMHWGHAVSADLLNWKEKGIAISPDEETGMVFSGSALIDRHNVTEFFPDQPGLVAFYTGHIPGDTEDEYLQHQCMAHSPDGGSTWVPYEHNPVIQNPGLLDFRDPKVFYHGPSRAWVMVVVAGREAIFYRSKNLKEWTESGRFGEGYGLPEGVWECPDVFSLPHPSEPGKEVWILAVSALGRGKPTHSPVQYFVGDFDGSTFNCQDSPEAFRLVDYGHDFYATQSWAGLEDRSIWIAWANHWAYANEVPAENWRGKMSIPRELSLVEKDGSLQIRQAPVREFDSGGQNAPLPDAAAIAGVHDIRYRISNPTTDKSILEFRYSDGGVLTLEWNPGTEELVLDRTGVSWDHFHPEFETRPSVFLPVFGYQSLDLRVILDGSLIEVFALDGTVTFTSQIFPRASLAEIRFSEAMGVISDAQHRVLVPNSNR